MGVTSPALIGSLMRNTIGVSGAARCTARTANSPNVTMTLTLSRAVRVSGAAHAFSPCSKHQDCAPRAAPCREMTEEPPIR
jgi:hypothetical protein